MVVSTNLHFIHLKDMPLESMEIEIIGSKGREKEREKAGNKGSYHAHLKVEPGY